MTEIYVDADACPVRDEIFKVATRLDVKVFVVSNGSRPIRPPEEKFVRQVIVREGADAADDWIVAQAAAGDIVVTADIPLASRAIKKGAKVIAHTGKPFSEDSIGMALAMRNLMSELREAGDMRGSNPVFTPADRSRFLQGLENIIQIIKRMPA